MAPVDSPLLELEGGGVVVVVAELVGEVVGEVDVGVELVFDALDVFDVVAVAVDVALGVWICFSQ